MGSPFIQLEKVIGGAASPALRVIGVLLCGLEKYAPDVGPEAESNMANALIRTPI
jgi:hypothetical protein